MPYDERDDETRRFVATFDDDEFLEAVREAEIAGTRDVAGRVGCTLENARVRLDRLVERGELEKRTIGRRNIYTIAE